MDICEKRKLFCYICGEYTPENGRLNINETLGHAFAWHFGKQVIKDKWWAPNQCCSSCNENLLQWTHGHESALTFGVPMIWSDPGDHSANQCYFCVHAEQLPAGDLNVKPTMEYRSLPSAERPKPCKRQPPLLINQERFDELARDLDLEEWQLETLYDRFTEKNLVAIGVDWRKVKK